MAVRPFFEAVFCVSPCEIFRYFGDTGIERELHGSVNESRNQSLLQIANHYRASVMADAKMLVISVYADMLLAMTELVLLAKALADPTRVRILSALRGRELCVCEICDALEVSQSTLSTHLQVIRDAGLVRTRKQGKWVYYAPASEKETVTEAVFGFFTPGIRRDRQIQRDTERLKKRLAERNGDECCRGFEQKCCPKPKRK